MASHRSRPALAGVVPVLVAITALTMLVATTPTASAGAPTVVYLPPVPSGVITDHFRPPPTPYGSGNRGIDEVTVPGTPVLAPADGVVVFAGSVAGSLHVTIRHADGLRSTCSFLATVAVEVGQSVAAGVPVGTTGAVFHFGVRDPEGRYLDPEALWSGRRGARLVAGPDETGDHRAPAAVERERRALEATVGELSSSPDRARLLARAHLVGAGDPALDLLALRRELGLWASGPPGCAPPATDGPAAPPPPGRRVLVLVGGLGSSGDSDALLRLDTAALGYAPGDVVRFSYAGGRVPSPAGVGPALAGLAARDYEPADTEGSLLVAADRLVDLLVAVGRALPGVPVDVVAHSQGGVVARLALDDARVGVASFTALASPFQGAPLATAAVGLGRVPSVAVGELAETSSLVARLDRPAPSGVRVLSVGASGDLTVPAVRTAVAGGTNVIVALGGAHAHTDLPGDARVLGLIARARTALPPACPSGDAGPTAVADVVQSHVIARAESGLSLALAGVEGSG